MLKTLINLFSRRKKIVRPVVGQVVRVNKKCREEIESYPWIPDLTGKVGEVTEVQTFGVEPDEAVVVVRFDAFSVRFPKVGSGCGATDEELLEPEMRNTWYFYWHDAHPEYSCLDYV